MLVEKVDKNAYYMVLRYDVLPWLTQGDAPSYITEIAQTLCKANSTELWLSSSLDMNMLDNAMCDILG